MTQTEPDDLVEKLQIQQGRLMYELVHQHDIETRDLFHLKGQIYGLETALHIAREDPDGDGPHSQVYDQYRALSMADGALREALVEVNGDREPDDLGYGVR